MSQRIEPSWAVQTTIRAVDASAPVWSSARNLRHIHAIAYLGYMSETVLSAHSGWRGAGRKVASCFASFRRRSGVFVASAMTVESVVVVAATQAAAAGQRIQFFATDRSGSGRVSVFQPRHAPELRSYPIVHQWKAVMEGRHNAQSPHGGRTGGWKSRHVQTRRDSQAGRRRPTPIADYLAEGSSLAELASRLDALLKSYSQDVAAADVRDIAHQESTASVKQPASEIVAATVEDKVTKVPSGATPLDCAITPANLPDDLRSAAIMIIDVEQGNIRAVQNVLRAEGYGTFITTTVPRDAMKLLRERKPDVLLLDIRMPDVTGIDILHAKRLDESLVHIPTIVMTATKNPVSKRQALDLGACDFLPKPLDPNDLIPRVRNALLVKKHHDQMVHQADRLEELIKRRTADLEESRRELVMSLARAAEHRDTETGNHVLRVGCYAGLIASELGWPSAQIEILELAAPLHDVGKIGVPDHILFKPGKLDPDEFAIIENHCVWGKEIIQPFSASETRALRSHTRRGGAILHIRGSAVLMMASRIAQTHHENWDGTGYPLGLAGEDIPLEGRIVAIADNFDALSTRRPYKRPFSRDECFRIMKQQREKKFDPRLLDMFFELSDKICQIQMELMDPTPQFGNLTEELPGPPMADEYSI